MVDTILPKTDTPGALELQVDQFIDLVIANILDTKGQQAMQAQLDSFNTQCQEEFGDFFANLSSDKRTEVLRREEQENPKFNKKIWGSAVGEEQKPVGVYRTLKSMALWGYFSSEAIGKKRIKLRPNSGSLYWLSSFGRGGQYLELIGLKNSPYSLTYKKKNLHIGASISG